MTHNLKRKKRDKEKLARKENVHPFYTSGIICDFNRTPDVGGYPLAGLYCIIMADSVSNKVHLPDLPV